MSLIIYFSGSLQSPAPPPPVQQTEQPAYDIENVISDEAGINTQENAIIRGKWLNSRRAESSRNAKKHEKQILARICN